MFGVISVDQQQNIVFFNKSAEHIFGWTAEQMLGQPLTRLLPDRVAEGHPRHVAAFGATGATSRRMSGSTVVYGRRADGEEFPVDASISQVDTPEGKVYTVLLRDVTERQRAEQEQARLAARLAGLLDSAMDGIITIDQAQRIQLYNRAAEKIFGWPASQVIGRRLDLLLPSRMRGAHERHVRQFGATGITSRQMGDGTVITGLRASGEEFPIDASISQLDTGEGKIFTVILRDVTERVRAQQEVAAAAAFAHSAREQERSRVARELHDELAQTLTALKMDVSWLGQHLDQRQAVADKLPEMQKLIDVTVAATRRIAADLRPLLLDDLGMLPAIEWLAQNFHQRNDIEVQLNVPEELELGEPHASAIFRMVQESLVNVAKHAQAKSVAVSMTVAGPTLLLTIVDDGCGFDPTQPRQANSLGLAGLRERTQLLNGRLSVHSAPGQGTRIEIRIPLPQQDS